MSDIRFVSAQVRPAVTAGSIAMSRRQSESSVQPAFDRFIRFGADTPVSPDAVKPLPESDPSVIEKKNGLLQNILDFLKDEPGFKEVEDTLQWVKRNGCSDKELLGNLRQRLDHHVTCHEAPPETIVKALNAGLQELFDDALDRQVDYGKKLPFLISGDNEDFALFHVGQVGSKKFLPKMAQLLETGTDEQKESTMNALSWMRNSYDRDAAIGAMKLYAKYEKADALKRVVNESVNCFAYLDTAASTASPQALEAICKFWDKYGKEHETEKYSTSQKILVNAFLSALVAKTPGAIEAITARKESLIAYFDAKMVEDESFFNPNEKELHQLLKAGLFGESLSDLPPREAPPGTDERRGWVFSLDYNYYTFFTPVVEAMAARGVPGAAELAETLKTGRDDMLIQEFNKRLSGNLLMQKQRDGSEKLINYFEDYDFRQQLRLAEQVAGPRVLPILDEISTMSWKKMDHFMWTSSGEPWTEDKQEAVWRKWRPGIRKTMDIIKVRLGLI